MVSTRDTIIAPYKNLFEVFIEKMDPLRLLILSEWHISTIESVRNAMVVPSGLLTNSQAPLST